MSSTFLTAEWRNLIMAQYAVDTAALIPHLPPGLELDLYRDPARPHAQPACFVSLVGFLFTRVRLKGLAVPFHTAFEEVNLRFYVKRPMPSGHPDAPFRRGVVFLSEIVPKPAITLTARALYGEAYSTARTHHAWSTTPAGDLDIRYDWRHRHQWQTLAVTARPTPQPIAPGSLEEFITEHYWGYTRRRRLFGRAPATGEYGVTHPRWQTHTILNASIHADFGSLYDPPFAPLSQRSPDHVLFSEGSAISIKSGGHFTA